jgi:stage IV sporulation protein FB
VYLGRWLGIKVYLNPGFIVLATLYAVAGMIVPLLIVFACLMIHELAHAVVAGALGVQVTKVEMLPFGGQAVIEEIMAVRPEKEMAIALAGPAVSLLLAGASFWLQDIAATRVFMTANLVLGLFNLLPALPLDGGRVLRALFGSLIGFKKATLFAAFCGQVVAVLLAIAGGLLLIWGRVEGVNPVVMGIVLYFASTREKRLIYYSFVRYLIRKRGILERDGHVAARAVVTRGDVRVKTLLSQTGPADYLVAVVSSPQGHPRGLLLEENMVEAYLDKGPGLSVEDLLDRQINGPGV